VIDFSTLKGLTIPEGVVTKITSNGSVLWELQSDTTFDTITLEVSKFTADTYSGETTYSGEQFVLLDIYPKTNGTVTITYGDLVKTISDTSGATEPNAQQVFFGTLYGVSDTVETPASGTLTIEGACVAFGVGSFVYNNKSNTDYCSCITAVNDFGSVSYIPDNAFRECPLEITEIPTGIKSIGDNAFNGCTNVAVSVIPDGVETIGAGCFLFTNNPFTTSPCLYLPATIKSIGSGAFEYTNGEDFGNYSYFDDIYIYATTPPTLSASPSNTFGGAYVDSLVFVRSIYVPKGCKEVYDAAEHWSDNSTSILEMIE